MSFADDFARLNRSAATLHGGSKHMDMVRANAMLQTVIDKTEKARKLILRFDSLETDDYGDMLYLTEGAKVALAEAQFLLAKHKG